MTCSKTKGRDLFLYRRSEDSDDDTDDKEANYRPSVTAEVAILHCDQLRGLGGLESDGLRDRSKGHSGSRVNAKLRIRFDGQ